MESREQSAELIRKLRLSLGSIDITDIEDKFETEEDRKAYCSAISIVFPRLKKDIERFMNLQAEFTLNRAENFGQVIFGRGNFNGADILLTKWDRANQEHLVNLKPKEGFDKTSPLGEI